MGSKPSTVVVVVNKTGLSLCAPVIKMASLASFVFFINLSKVSIKTILLFTTMPANEITPIPLMTIPNGCFVIKSPKTTPTVDIITANKINKVLLKLLNWVKRIKPIKNTAIKKAFCRKALDFC